MPRLALYLCTVVFVLGPLASARALASDWKPIEPRHLALKQPLVDPSADAEALLWEVHVADEVDSYGEPSTVFEQYVRVKIFTDRGREAFSTVDIPYSSGTDVTSVAARIVRPDGSIVELKKSDIFQRTILKANDLKIKATSFAVPGLAPGVIVEYTWREVHRDSLAANLRLRFSRDIPVHEARYLVRPISVPGYSMVAWPFNAQFNPPEKRRDGYTVLSLANVPAHVDEEYGFPEFEHRPWVFIGYEPKGRSDSPDFVKRFGKDLYEEYAKRAKPNDVFRRLASEAVAGAANDAARVAALVKVAREKVRRVDVDTADPADLRKVRELKNATDSLTRGIGTADDLLLVFLALAAAADLDARVVALPSRADLFPRSIRAHPSFTPGRIVAVRSGSEWLFADPSNEYAASGELPWEYEKQRVQIADPREVILAETPLSPATYSVKKRTGTFRLLADGTLDGEARVEYTGHWADVLREQEDQDAAAERETELRDLILKRLPGAELSEVRVEHVTDPSRPYTNSYRIRIPGYAQRAGTRLVIQPTVFQKGVAAVFAPAERKTGIHFPFAWTEEDMVTIDLPAGHAIEQPTPRTGFDVGGASYEQTLTVTGTRIVFQRKLAIAKQGIVFDTSAYKPFRAFFDAVHRADTQTTVVRRTDSSK